MKRLIEVPSKFLRRQNIQFGSCWVEKQWRCSHTLYFKFLHKRVLARQWTEHLLDSVWLLWHFECSVFPHNNFVLDYEQPPLANNLEKWEKGVSDWRSEDHGLQQIWCFQHGKYHCYHMVRNFNVFFFVIRFHYFVKAQGSLAIAHLQVPLCRCGPNERLTTYCCHSQRTFGFICISY